MTQSFYYAPTRITFGPGSEDNAALELQKEGVRKVLIHYGSNRIEKDGLLEKITSSLRKNNIEYILFSGVKPNPRLSLVKKAAEKVKEEGVDFILALGGGSVIDSAKAIGYAVKYPGDVWDLYSGKAVPRDSLGVGAVLTMAAAGSEMSDSSVITNDEDGFLKRGVNSNICRLKFALLNPELTYSLPPFQTAAGIVDIQMHTLERYFSRGGHLPLTDNLSLSLIKTVAEYGRTALKEPDNYEARAALMWASSLSHNGLMAVGSESRGDWASHQLEHELSGKYDMAHGEGLAVVWPAWARYTLSSAPERFQALGISVFGIEKTENPLRDGENTIRAFENFYHEIGMPVKLSEAGIFPKNDEILELSDKCSFHSTRTIGDLKKLDREDIENIYRMCL